MEELRGTKQGLKTIPPLPNPPHRGEGREEAGERGAGRKIVDRELYRQTLEELARRRTQFASRTETDQIQTKTDKNTPLPQSLPTGGGGKGEGERGVVPPMPSFSSRISDIGAGARPNIPFIGYDQPFSVNEAVYRGDIEKTKDRGEIVKGSEEVDERLKELKKKINDKLT